MLTFSLNFDQTTYIDKICLSIQENKNYIKKFHPKNPEEASLQILDTCVRNIKPEYDVVDPYVKKTTRMINKGMSLETPYDTMNEDGEVASPFLSLVQNDQENIEIGVESKIINILAEMYLLDPDFVMSLKPVFYGSDLNNKELKQQYKTTNQRIIELGIQLREFAKYKAFMKGVTSFYLELQNKTKVKKAASAIKEIKIKDIKYDLLDYLPTEPLLRDANGKDIGFDLITLYSEIDLDLNKWSVKYKEIAVQKIDITEYIDFLYSNVFVEKGVNNKVITWAVDNNYKLTMPSGIVKLNEDRNKFIELCYRELFLNILNSNIGLIIGATPDSIYIKKRGAGIKTVRCILCYNKTIDLPVVNI